MIINKNIDIGVENDIISSINTEAPKCFGKFNPEKVILEKTPDNDPNIVKSLNNIVIRNKIYSNAQKILNNNQEDKIIQDYKKNSNILELTKKFDLPPLYLLNIIFKNKYDKNIIYIIKHKDILDKQDYQSFNIAYHNDYFTIENKFNKEILVYKEFIKNYLFKNKIKFTEHEFWFETFDYEFNKKHIHWILYSNDYGSCLEKKYPNQLDTNIQQIQSQSKYKNKTGIIFFANNICSQYKISNSILIYLKQDNNFEIANNIQIRETSKSGDFYKFGIESKTDKVTHHYYYKYYPLFLEKYRHIIKNNSIKWAMMEIGIDSYRSLKLWEKYFPQAYIYGLDIGIGDKGKNFEIFKCDQSNITELTKVSDVILEQDKKMFFIIDDGSHHPDHQILTFNLFFDKLLAYGGCYIIEDVETSYWTKNKIYAYDTRFGYKKSNSAIELAKNLIDDVNGEFLSDDNKSTHTKSFSDLINENVRGLVANIFFGQNNIIIMKKNLDDLVVNKREYRFKENL